MGIAFPNPIPIATTFRKNFAKPHKSDRAAQMSKGGILQFEAVPEGATTKEGALAYCKKEAFFNRLVEEFDLTPCYNERTRILYSYAELDRAIEEATTHERLKKHSRNEGGAE